MLGSSRVLAGVCGAWLALGGAAGAMAGPAEGAPADAAATEDAPEAEEAAAEPAPTSTASVPSLRRRMESGMAKLGDLAEDAKRDADLARATCVLDKQERAQGVMELATGELLVIRDQSSSAEARGFAVEKLDAAAERLDDLVEQAKVCTGDATPEVDDDQTANTLDEEPSIPIADPTLGGGPDGTKPSRIPPMLDAAQPPTVGSPSF